MNSPETAYDRDQQDDLGVRDLNTASNSSLSATVTVFDSPRTLICVVCNGWRYTIPKLGVLAVRSSTRNMAKPRGQPSWRTRYLDSVFLLSRRLSVRIGSSGLPSVLSRTYYTISVTGHNNICQAREYVATSYAKRHVRN